MTSDSYKSLFTGASREAVDAGMIFYSPPESLTEAMVDPLLWPAVQCINASGWVMTGESCQGHPDATGYGETAWPHNSKPFLRLICREANLDRMMGTLVRAWVELSNEPMEHFAPGAIEMFPRAIRQGWSEVMVYIQASNAAGRNMGCKVFERFAQLLHVAI